MAKFKNFYNKITNDGRIFSFEDVVNIPHEEDKFYSAALDYQCGKIGFPREKELQNSMNVSKVEPFTYEDGSVTRAHFRSNDSEQFIDPNKPFMTTPSMEKTRLEKKMNDGFGSNGFGSKPTGFASPIQKQTQQNNAQVQQNIQPLQGHIQYNEQPSNVIKENQASQTGYQYNGKPITAEQNRQIQEIQEKFSNERKQIERDRILGHSKNVLGAALEIGSAVIPRMGGAKIAGALGKKFIPMFGKKIANEIAAGITSGAVSGAVGGAGDGLLNNKNPLISGLQGLIGGAALGGATGFGTGKLLKYFDRKNLYKTKAPEDISKKYYSDYGKDSLNLREVISDIRSAKIDGGDARKATSDIQFDEISDIDDYYSKHTKNGKSIDFSSIIEEDSYFPISRTEEEMLRSEINTYYKRNPNYKKNVFYVNMGNHRYKIENYGFDKYKIVDMEFIDYD